MKVNMLYKTIYFPFSSLFREYTLEQTKKLIDNPIYILNIKISDEDRYIVNKYLNDRGISNLLNILCFRRKNSEDSYHQTHIDSNTTGAIHCSVVIPVSGCQNTEQFWYNGNYEMIEKTVPKTFARYADIKWKNVPEKIGSVEINNPTLVRTDIPHGVYNNNFEYRTTCTIRFIENESFEYLSERLST